MPLSDEEMERIDRMAGRITDRYPEEADRKVVRALTSIVLVIIGLLIGAYSLWMFYPLIQGIQALGSVGN